MSLNSSNTPFEGVILIEPTAHVDHRGFFMETFHKLKYGSIGVKRAFVQDNLSHSKRGVLRGLHYQLRHPQAKLIWVSRGEIYDVVVDVRVGSPTFGRWWATVLSDANRRQLFVSEGFAHGFYVLSDEADVIYKCSDFYDPEDDRGIRWDDPSIGISWPSSSPILSTKDEGLPLLSDLAKESLPHYGPTSRPNQNMEGP